ncbi:hypothetical protein [Brevibacterium sp. FAM 27836]|uniref:hypothetical protein n=1 Tax=Brevibacterium sp. FAM 27836 TaxID=3446693 RepID=UPI003F5148A3
MNNTSGKRHPNALADRIAGINDPSMGDERERDVTLRAYTFGSVVSMYVFFGLGLFFAVIGAGLWTLPIFLASGAMGVAASSYCKREAVDIKLATARVAPKRRVKSYLFGALFTVAWIVAITFHETTGHPLIDAGLGSTLGFSDSGTSMLIGLASGIIVVASLEALQRHRKLKQTRLEAARAAEIEDED